MNSSSSSRIRVKKEVQTSKKKGLKRGSEEVENALFLQLT